MVWLKREISIHAAREGGDYKRLTPLNKEIISIHAAREGGDGQLINISSRKRHFNPRRP